MDAQQLRAIQAPLKARYRDNPQRAQIPARAVGVLDVEALTCAIVGRESPMVAGLHRAAGGSGDLACSADMLLEALVACVGVTLCAVATAMGVGLRGGIITAEGVWDARGTLGIDRDAPVGVTDIRLNFDIDCGADPATLKRLIETTERYCVILQTLVQPSKIETALWTAPPEWDAKNGDSSLGEENSLPFAFYPR